ncbi:BatA domain-containing protein [Mucilaginibacter rigui]|uniref:BatA domain-containing protein n=1 Tax=Mucilaginibacter rigui TaxID=534635 RepID=A0ABR7X684_9SPHI|nr:BatA domain-containing protein [Mucilaginibacter rigui]MBD1386011.1 BatA domain-containing protein [Mucilaginibacter rigui]
MQFLNPIWFFALAAITIPVIIHLWNIRPGKTLKVGSISLITEASKSTRRSFKLLDILLLILRCLLLILIALLLAAPVWQKYVATQKKGWVLIPKESLKETYQKFKPTIDSLDKAGYEFHYFNRGFAKQDLKTILADSSLKDTTINANYWSLVKQLENQVGDAPVYLFTQNGIEYFKGSKPQVKLNALHWQTYTAKDSTAKWIDKAFINNNGAIKVIIGNSIPSSTYFTTQTIQGGGNNDVTVNVQNGQPFVSLKNTAQSVPVDTSTLRIAIYTDKHQLDAGYLKAALSAAADFMGRKWVIKEYSSPAQIPAGQAWVFWLSEQPVKPDQLKSSKNIFQYEAGKVTDVTSWIDPGHIALAKRINSTNSYEAVWKDGFGNPVLVSGGNTWHFYSRFNPLWSDLVWSDDFPKLMLKLLLGNGQSQPKGHERRILGNRQLQPGIFAQSMPQLSSKTNEQTDLSKYFWLLAVLLFIAERILSHKKTTNNG